MTFSDLAPTDWLYGLDEYPQLPTTHNSTLPEPRPIVWLKLSMFIMSGRARTTQNCGTWSS